MQSKSEGFVDWLNYHHLYYFWTVVREGTVAEASEKLHLAPSTVSKQVGQLEEQLGRELFDRSGRKLVLNDFGQMVYRYAEEIFAIGHELLEFAGGHQVPGVERLHVAATESIPKLMVRRVLGPVLEAHGDVQLMCHEGHLGELLDDLAIHRLDVVLTDRPLPVEQSRRAVAHRLGASVIGFYAAAEQAERLRESFPDELEGVPMLLPTSDAAIRPRLDAWFARENIHPNVVAQFQDAAQMKAFGETGTGVFPAPVVLEEAIADQYDIRKIGEADGVEEIFFAIAGSRQIEHPAVGTLVERARAWLET